MSVDPRFTLANERTFLAWVRTSLALIGGGAALAAFGHHLVSSSVQTALSAALLLMGALLAGSSYSRWRRLERAIRAGEDLPPSPLVPLLAAAVALVAGVLLVALVAWPR